MHKGNDISLPKTRKGALALAAGIAAAAVLTAVFFLTVEKKVSLIHPDCLLRTFAGIKCFLCGGTRCAREIIGGNFAKALYYNPFAVLCGMLAAVWYIRLIISLFAREYRPLQIKRSFLWVFLGAILLFSAVRNTDFYQSIFY